MAKIYRMSDRIRLKIDDIEVVIGPLSIHQKAAIEEVSASSGLLKATMEAMRYAIKDVNGLKTADGSNYQLQRDDEGYISEESLNDLFNIEQSYRLSTVCLNLINNIPDEFVDLNTGKKLEGVEFVVDKDAKGKKSKAGSVDQDF